MNLNHNFNNIICLQSDNVHLSENQIWISIIIYKDTRQLFNFQILNHHFFIYEFRNAKQSEHSGDNKH